MQYTRVRMDPHWFQWGSGSSYAPQCDPDLGRQTNADPCGSPYGSGPWTAFLRRWKSGLFGNFGKLPCSWIRIPITNTDQDPVEPNQCGSSTLKKAKKKLITTALWLIFYDCCKCTSSKRYAKFIYLFIYEASWKSQKKRVGAGSANQWCGSADQDPYRIAKDGEHWFLGLVVNELGKE